MTQDISNFEKDMKRLSEIVKDLEIGNVSLEKTLLSFEEGMKLIVSCKEQLNVAEERVKTLTKTNVGYEEKPGVE